MCASAHEVPWLAKIPGSTISVLNCEEPLLVKKTSKNQVTLPKKVLQDIPDTEYFDVITKDGVLILRPVTVAEPGSRLAVVGRTINALGIQPKDLDQAIACACARRRPRR